MKRLLTPNRRTCPSELGMRSENIRFSSPRPRLETVFDPKLLVAIVIFLWPGIPGCLDHGLSRNQKADGYAFPREGHSDMMVG
jgi:hypothetical protein